MQCGWPSLGHCKCKRAELDPVCCPEDVVRKFSVHYSFDIRSCNARGTQAQSVPHRLSMIEDC